METLSDSATPTLVSNIEVMKILSERIASRKDAESGKQRKQSPQLQHRDWVEGKVLEYIQSTPCASTDIERMPRMVSALRGEKGSMQTGKGSKKTSDAQTKRFSTREGFGLTDGETLQVLNFMPQEPVEIHLMIEELHSRMSDERQGELLQLIGSYAAQQGNVAVDGDHVMEETNQYVSTSVGKEISCVENGHIDTEKQMGGQKLNGDELIDSGVNNDVVMKEEPP